MHVLVNSCNIVPNYCIKEGRIKPMCLSYCISPSQPENAGSTYDCHLPDWIHRRIQAKDAYGATFVHTFSEAKVEVHDQT